MFVILQDSMIDVNRIRDDPGRVIWWVIQLQNR